MSTRTSRCAAGRGTIRLVSFSVRTHGDPQSGHTITVTGELDAATAPALRAELDELRSAPGVPLVVDLRDLVFIDSSGLGVLATAANRRAAEGTVLVVANPSAQARAVLELTNLDQVISIVENQNGGDC